MTPRTFRALFDRWQERERRTWLRTGVIAATIANFAGKQLRDGKTLGAEDFVPGGKPRNEDEPTEQGKAMYQVMEAAFGSMMTDAD